MRHQIDPKTVPNHCVYWGSSGVFLLPYKTRPEKKKEGQWGAGQHTLISTEDSWAPPSKSIWNSPVIKPRRPGASWRLKHKEQRHPTEDWEALPVRLPALNAKGMDLPFLIINLALVPETLPHCRRNSSPSSMQQAAIALKRETWRHEQFPK